MKGFTEKLLSWYELAHRKLPWRVSTDPYRVWLSEIILQQTRVSQGMSYYLDFITQYPDVASLAKASEVEVLKMWQGLGYYSRARNMLHAARQVVNEYGGRFPDNRDDLLSLKGIGNYTAAAISSISFGETVPVVDGNVKRVVARIFGVQSTGQALYDEVEALMASYIHHERPGDFNQAVMEFGALQCIPRNPDCEACIFSDRCYALKNGMISELPGKEPKSRPKERYFSYLLVKIHDSKPAIIMKKRTGSDIWKNLYDLPLIETEKELDVAALLEHPTFLDWFVSDTKITLSTGIYKHQLTHRTIISRFHFIDVTGSARFKIQKGWELINLEELDQLPVPRLVEKFLSEYKLI